MDLNALKEHLLRRKKDIEAELNRLSAIYNTKISLSGPRPNNPINPPVPLSQEDRLKMLAMENERLRALIKGIAVSAETELKLLETVILDVKVVIDKDKNKLQAELESAKVRIKELEAVVPTREPGFHQVTEVNALLNRQLLQKDEEVGNLTKKLNKLKKELEVADSIKRAPAENLEKSYVDKFNLQAQAIKTLESEKALLRNELQQLLDTFGDRKNNIRSTTPQREATGLDQSQLLQKNERIYDELNSLRSEIAQMTKLQTSNLMGAQGHHANERLSSSSKPVSYYKEKVEVLKRELTNFKERESQERKRVESLEALVSHLRNEKVEVAQKLAKRKAKLKQLMANPDSRLIEGHIRGLEQQIAARKEESDRFAHEKTTLISQVEDLKTQLATKTSQIEQLNSTLLKFASNFKTSEGAPAMNLPSQQRLISETPNPKAQAPVRGNNFRSVYKNFARIDEMEEPDLHFDLSLNIPPDIEAFEHENLGHFNKLKHVVRELNEKQQTHLKNLEQKSDKIKELKKLNKNLKKEIDELQKENSNLRQASISTEARYKRLEEDFTKLQQERKMLRSDLEETKEKLSRTEEKIERLNKLERDNRKVEKESEYYQKLSEQKNVEIEGLLRNLREREDHLRSLITRSQQLDPVVAEEQSTMLAKSNKKLKKFLKRMQDDFFRLEEENNALKEAIEREVELREQIIEDFTEKAASFETKVELFGEFQRNLEDFQTFFSSSQNS